MGASLPLLARLRVSNAERNGWQRGRNLRLEHASAQLPAQPPRRMALLPALGLSSTIALAASVNVLAGAAAIYMRYRKWTAPTAASADLAPFGVTVAPDRLIEILILIGFAASGFAATTFEVSWTRLLAMVMGSSVYAFGTLVVVVLAGLGLGSGVYSLRCERQPPRNTGDGLPSSNS